MASGDFTDLATRACYLAQRNPSVAADLARAKEAVNEALIHVVASGDPWDFCQAEGQWTTAAGSSIYTYASIATAIGVSEIAEIHSMVNDTDGSSELTSMTWADLENLASSTNDDDASGWPVCWSKWGGSGGTVPETDSSPKIRLYPTPDAVYEIGTYCRIGQAELTADASLITVPLKWRHRVIVPYAAKVLLEQDASPRSAVMIAEFEQGFAAMRAAHATAKTPTFSVVSAAVQMDRDWF